MAEESVICTECGKDMPAGFHVCPECGARRARTRRSRSAAPEPPGSQVTAVTDAVRSVPRPPAKRSTGFRATRHKSKHRHHRSAPPSRLAQVLRERDQSAPPPGRSLEDGAEEVLIGPDGEPIGVRRLARRKIYRYGRTRHQQFAYRSELRAILILIAIGIILVLMCRLEGGSFEPPQAAVPAPSRIAMTTDPKEVDPRAQEHQLLVVSLRNVCARDPQDCEGSGLRCG